MRKKKTLKRKIEINLTRFFPIFISQKNLSHFTKKTLRLSFVSSAPPRLEKKLFLSGCDSG